LTRNKTILHVEMRNLIDTGIIADNEVIQMLKIKMASAFFHPLESHTLLMLSFQDHQARFGSHTSQSNDENPCRTVCGLSLMQVRSELLRALNKVRVWIIKDLAHNLRSARAAGLILAHTSWTLQREIQHVFFYEPARVSR